MSLETTLPVSASTAPSAAPIVLPRVLFVDDDASILDGFRRQFRKTFHVHTALGPLEGLATIAEYGPFGVVVSDFQMPGMDGIQFLTKVRAQSPDSVRIMLTGQADFSTAMAAVNQGNIFRFLIKPCSAVILEKVIETGLDQHRLQKSERQLTEETLLGCVQVLVEVLSIVQPEAFSRATRVRRYVRQIAEELGLAGGWQLEAAAMLSQIGWITLPPALLDKAATNAPMSAEEYAMFLTHAAAAGKLLERIPRLDGVAKIIAMQHLPLCDLPEKPLLQSPHTTTLGAQMLKAAIDFDGLRQKQLSSEKALDSMQADAGVYMPEVLAAMQAIMKTELDYEVRTVSAYALAAGMILEDDLIGKNGVLLLAKGHEITATFLTRLINFTAGMDREPTCKVRVHKSPATQTS
jgi:response regulator RpfG family c-di-GMP phosphodiesterase